MLITNPSSLKKYHAEHRIWQGIPGIEHTKNGRTFVSFYSGNTKETYGNYAAVIMSDDETNYGEPIAVAYKEGIFRCFDPVLWIDPLGRLWFVWNVMPGEEVMAVICDDPDAENLVWSKEFYIGRGIMMNKPTVLSTGEWLFPIAIWKLDIFNNFRNQALTDDDVPLSYVYKTSDNGKSFVRLGGADVPQRSCDEHMVYEMNNGVLRMLVRLHNGIGESYSYDRGKRWSKGHKTELDGPSSRFFIKKLKSGRVLLINHYNFTKRNNLTALLSEDDGVTFPYSLLLDERDSVSYPDAVECEDGMIRIVYDRERGCFRSSLEEAYSSARELLTAAITEDDIIAGSLRSQNGYLKRVVCKLSRLSEEDPDPYDTFTSDNSTWIQTLLDDPSVDPIDRVFERFPLDCAERNIYEFKKLDGLISQFKESGSKDERLLKQIINIVSGVSKPEDSHPIVDLVLEYINSHISEDISNAEIAKKHNISVYYLSHIFRAVTGTNIREYRNELKLTKAKLMLKNTDISIGQIACEVGFESISYFTEVFSKSETISPKEYRELHKRG